jgi:hypothetical protein
MEQRPLKRGMVNLIIHEFDLRGLTKFQGGCWEQKSGGRKWFKGERVRGIWAAVERYLLNLDFDLPACELSTKTQDPSHCRSGQMWLPSQPPGLPQRKQSSK